MKDKNIYEYGQLLKIAPTYGVDVNPGEIVITGIMHPDHLPNYIDFQSWESGEAEFDFQLATQPWYFFQYTNGYDEDETHNLPQFALEEVVDKAIKIIKMGEVK